MQSDRPQSQHPSRPSSRRAPSLCLAAALLGLLALARTAQAQQPSRNVDLPRFDPAPAGDLFFGVPSPFTPGHTVLRGGVLLDYANNPLLITDANGNTVGHVVEHQMLLHLDFTLTLLDRLAVNVDLPFAVVNRGDGRVEAGPFTGADAFTSPSGAGVGDLRLGARVRLHGGYFDPFQLALGGYLWVPTGSKEDFLTDGKVRGQIQALAGGRIDRFIWTAMVGPTLRSSQTYGAVKIGSQLNWGAGAGVLLGEQRRVQLGVETTGGLTLVTSARSYNSELFLGAKLRVTGPIEVGLAGGRGFASGLGTPDFRGLFTLFYTPRVERPVPVSDSDGDGIADSSDACPQVKGIPSGDPTRNGCPPPADRDGDGIPDGADACPNEAGRASDDPKKNGCPPPKDQDGDGILDDVDACPNEVGVPSDDPKKNGCRPPQDHDGDGVIDAQDACPELAGVKTDDPATNGCPGDADQDGFRDDLDACPKEKGVDDPDPAKRGCPKLVRINKSEIVILEQIQFDTNRATIKPVSDALLASIAQVMKDHPEIGKFEVQGHTDDRGKKARNAKLSQERADAVMKALVARGVDAARLRAKGFGQDVPIAPNGTDEGRQKNRRVQFLLLDTKPAADQQPAGDAPAGLEP